MPPIHGTSLGSSDALAATDFEIADRELTRVLDLAESDTEL